MTSKNTLLCLCGILLSVSVTGLAQEVPQLELETYELENGLDVILYENHALPKVSVNILYNVGSKNEKPGKTGFAHLFEHMMFQGSENHNVEYYESLNPIGALVNGGTSEDWTMYWEDIPREHLELALWLEADRMGFLLPALSQEKFDNQRDVVKNERRQNYENSPYAKSSLILASMLYPSDHPYSWLPIGSQEDLTAATLEDVSDFFRRFYTPNNASLVVAGDFDPAIAKKLVRKYFAGIPAGPSVDRLTEWIPQLQSVRRATAEDDVDLARLYYVWHSPPHYQKGDAEADLLASILTQGKSSRLFKSLVYDKQIAQDVSAFQVSQSLGSQFRVVVTAREGHSLEEIEMELDAELDRLLDEGVSQGELELVLASWEARFIRGLERIGGFFGIAGSLNFYNTLLGNPNRFAWDMARYQQASIEGINAMAREFLRKEHRATLHIVPHGSLTASDTPLDRTQKPGPGEAATFVPPRIESAWLENGLQILVVEDNKLPLVQTSLVIKSGWTDDDLSHPGAATLAAAMLDEGTASRSALEISDRAQELAAQLSTDSGFDGSFVRLNVLRKNLDAGLELMADIALNPSFSEEELDRQRKNYVGRMQSAEKDPAARSRRALMKALFGEKHPYGQLMWRPTRGGAIYFGLGSTESVNSLTREQLIDFYENHYRPNNASLVFAGNISLEEATRKAETFFGRWKSGSVPESKIHQTTEVSGTRIIIVDKPGAPQSMIVAGSLGLRYSDEEFPAMQMVQQVLGGSFQRLDKNLREDKGYAYGAGFSLWDNRQRGPMYVIAPVQTQSTKESIQEILLELRDIAGTRPIDAAELATASATLIKQYPAAFESVGGIAAQLEKVVLQGLGEHAWTEQLETWSSISLAEANHAARSRIHPDSVVFVVVGDRSVIEPGIRELELGEVEVLAADS